MSEINEIIHTVNNIESKNTKCQFFNSGSKAWGLGQAINGVYGM